MKKEGWYLPIIGKIAIAVIVIMVPLFVAAIIKNNQHLELDKQQRAALAAKHEQEQKQREEILALGGNPDSTFKYVYADTENSTQTEESEQNGTSSSTSENSVDKATQQESSVSNSQESSSTQQTSSIATSQTSSEAKPAVILPNTRSQIEMANNPVVGDIVYGVGTGTPLRWDGKKWVYAGRPVGERSNAKETEEMHAKGEYTDGSTEADKYVIWE